MDDGIAAPEPEAGLLARWRDAARDWRVPADWRSPAAHLLAGAIETGAPTEHAAFALGRARGLAGAGIAEALDDLAVPFRLAGAEADEATIRRFIEGWSDGSSEGLLDRGALDHRTGLATSDYLRTRLRDIARLQHYDDRRLVVADAAELVADAGNRLETMLRMALVAEAIRESFPGAETPVSLEGPAVAAVVPDDDGFAANLVRARLAIARLGGAEGGDVTVLPLPQAEEAVGAFVSGL